MGRSEKDALTAAQIMYPLMQCADIFFLKVSLLALGNLANLYINVQLYTNANLHYALCAKRGSLFKYLFSSFSNLK